MSLLEKLKKLNKLMVKADSDLRAAVARNPKVSLIVMGVRFLATLVDVCVVHAYEQWDILSGTFIHTCTCPYIILCSSTSGSSTVTLVGFCRLYILMKFSRYTILFPQFITTIHVY